MAGSRSTTTGPSANSEFAANAVVLVVQILLVSWLYPWSERTRDS